MTRRSKDGAQKRQNSRPLERDMSFRFKRVFSRLLPTRIATAPVKSGVMACITNTANCAFGAYQTPTVDGFVEHTTQQNTITHMSIEGMETYMEGALKIRLQNSRSLRNSDWFGNKSDPYVVFTSGDAFVCSSTKNNTLDPDWDNECHYLFIRKRHLDAETAKTLRVEVFDKDTRETQNKFYHVRQRDTSLGHTLLDLEQLKKPGLHEMQVTIAKRAARPDSTVAFTVEFIPVETALEEAKKDYYSDAWLDSMELKENHLRWPELANMTDRGDVKLEPVAFVEAVTTGTQAWIHINRSVNLIVVAFRGTEVAELKDILTDLKFFPLRFTAPMRSTKYAMHPTSTLLDSRIRLHRGFRDAYDSIRESILRLVYDITGWQDDWTVVTTGHSLGGALATISAFEMTHRTLSPQAKWTRRRALKAKLSPFKGKVREQGVKPNVTMISFGAPRVGTSAFARLYDQTVDISLRVINEDDPVPKIPPLYTHTGGEVVVRPAGNVCIGGTRIEKTRRKVRPRGIPATPQVADDDDTDDNSDDEVERVGIRVMSHLQPSYFTNIKAAVNQFFHEDTNKRGHPLRVTRNLALDSTYKTKSLVPRLDASSS